METVEALAYILALVRLRRRGITQADRVNDLLTTGDPERSYHRARAGGGQPSLLDVDDDLRRAHDDISRWLEAGYGIVSVLSDRYPSRVREVREAPALLYYQGALLSDDDAVCVIGSRQASPQGLSDARDAARALVAHGYTVLAGLAAGIDTAAHVAALDAGGRTVAIMGTGLDRTYPASNADLRSEIVKVGGLVLTQFAPGSPVRPANFPMRNAVMSGYGLASYVVEASEHSGTRTQTRLALHHGRQVILSQRVARGASWGQEAANSHDAAVISGPADLLTHVDALRRRREKNERWMAALS